MDGLRFETKRFAKAGQPPVVGEDEIDHGGEKFGIVCAGAQIGGPDPRERNESFEFVLRLSKEGQGLEGQDFGTEGRQWETFINGALRVRS